MTNVWITHLLEDRQGTLWVGTNQNGVIELQNGIVRRYAHDSGLPSDSVQCLFADARDHVWACTPGGLAEIAGETVRTFGSGGRSAGARRSRRVCEPGWWARGWRRQRADRHLAR